MPKLETLKKQAKQLVRWHRDGVWTVAERIRAGLPKCAGLSDQQILERPFPLAEAQELLAREAGLQTWAELIAGAGADAAPAVPADGQDLGTAEPTLFVTDFRRALAFFQQKLGFGVAFTFGEPAFFGVVQRGAARIGLRHVDSPVYVEGLQAQWHLIPVIIAAPNLKALYAEYQAAGVPFHQSLKRQPWGAQDFVVQDPDGNLIGFVFNP